VKRSSICPVLDTMAVSTKWIVSLGRSPGRLWTQNLLTMKQHGCPSASDVQYDSAVCWHAAASSVTRHGLVTMCAVWCYMWWEATVLSRGSCDVPNNSNWLCTKNTWTLIRHWIIFCYQYRLLPRLFHMQIPYNRKMAAKHSRRCQVWHQL